jgi:bifunctional UDP-N-acetylglucosamine pyrophosphorylase/glucosamine-1-phosphate N-acetyltransferase
MSDLHIVILAAGKGTRMKSAEPKVLHRAGGLPLIDHVLRIAESLQPKTVVLVVGHQADRIQEYLGKRPGLRFAEQEPQLGTGHALLQAEPHLAGADGTLILLSGDVPVLRPETLVALVRHHQATDAAATVVTARIPNPTGYGRIVREGNRIGAIVEEKDATAAERAIDEINSGIYAFELAPLFDALKTVGSQNAQGEYYLPDLVRIYRTRGLTVETFTLGEHGTPGDAREIMGVNSRRELADVSAILKSRRADELMAAGVTIVDPATTWIGPDVRVGADTILHPNVFLEGRTSIGSGCEIHACVRLVDATVDDGAVVHNFCVIVDAHVAGGAQVGPFAHLRPKSHVLADAKVGNFVELKNTTLGKGAKASHLTYLGDATIGENVNIGAGTITCNYDGTHKHPTVIEDGAFIGSDSQLIAPVRVGRGAYVAAGSSITEDVPAGALGIARGKQVNKPGWVEKNKKSK